MKEAQRGELIAIRAGIENKRESLFRRFISRSVSLGLIFPPITLIGVRPLRVLLGSTEDPVHEMWHEAFFGGFQVPRAVKEGIGGIGSKAIPGAKENEVHTAPRYPMYSSTIRRHMLGLHRCLSFPSSRHRHSRTLRSWRSSKRP